MALERRALSVSLGSPGDMAKLNGARPLSRISPWLGEPVVSPVIVADKPPAGSGDNKRPRHGSYAHDQSTRLPQRAARRGADKPSEYRIRRTRKTGTDRAYLPVLKAGTLTGPEADGVFTATVPTPLAELDPFVRYRWFAEARYPAEPPTPPHVLPEPVDGGVEPVWTTLGADSEAIWSDLSFAAESLLIPAKAPQPPPRRP